MRFLSHALRSRFFRHNIIFFFGAAVVGALNYLYYPVLGRVLDTTSFGEVQTLISLFLQITIFLSVLGLVAIVVVANEKSESHRNAVIFELEKLALLVSLVLLGATLIFGNRVATFLQFNSSLPFVLVVVALVASVPLTFRSAFLRGKQRFGLASLGNVVSAAGKLAFALLLVLLGFGTAGAIGGLVAAQCVACVLVVAWAARLSLIRPAGHRWISLPNFRLLAPQLRFGLLVLIGSLVITVHYSIDIVIVKRLFDPHTAGLYAGIASVARIIFFLTASIAMVLISMVRQDAAPGENQKALIKSLVLVSAASLPLLLLAVLAPARITGLLMGSNYESMAVLLPKLSIAIFLVSIVNVIVMYYLALRTFMLAPILLAGAGLTYILLYLNHASLQAVVQSLLTGSIAMLAILGLWMSSRHIKELLWQKR